MTGFESKVAHDLQEYNRRLGGSPVKGTKKDYITVYRDFCRGDGDYSNTFKTALYNKHGGEYCTLLEVLASKYREHQEPRKQSA